MKLYTKKGDQGFASTLRGDKLPKNHELIIIVGKIDSLQSALDYALISITDEKTKKIITAINEKLWQLAGEISNQGLNDLIKNPVTNKDVEILEKHIDEEHPKNTYFIRFTKETSCRLNEARTRTRDLESYLTKQLLENKLRPEAYKYLNRLSDLLYSLSCKEEK